MVSSKRRIYSTLLAWMIFIGVDFLFHASVFSSFWNDDIAALKPLDDLALLIPAGYLSFFLLTSLVAYVFFLIFKTKPEIKSVIYFGVIFASLFSFSNFFGLYSYIDLPIKHLMAFNFVYFIELLVIPICLYFFAFSKSLKKPALYSILIFVFLVFTGIVIQNIFNQS